MNIKIANRLIELRKKNGLSQEQLAEKLGLSRQAVSKWERAEASPDTDNLICLAKLYGVSLDDLLNTDESIDDIAKETKEKESEKKKRDKINIDKTGIHYIDEDGSEAHITNQGIIYFDKDDDINIQSPFSPKLPVSKKYKATLAIISAITTLVAITAYILLGCLLDESTGFGWYNTWMILLLIPLVPSIYEAIYKRKLERFCYPILVAGIYCFFGMAYDLWHPLWILFITIPLYYSIVKPIDYLLENKEQPKD